MNRIAPTIRAGLRALSLLLGASAIIGGATSGQATASPLDPSPSAMQLIRGVSVGEART